MLTSVGVRAGVDASRDQMGCKSTYDSLWPGTILPAITTTASRQLRLALTSWVLGQPGARIFEVGLSVTVINALAKAGNS